MTAAITLRDADEPGDGGAEDQRAAGQQAPQAGLQCDGDPHATEGKGMRRVPL